MGGLHEEESDAIWLPGTHCTIYQACHESSRKYKPACSQRIPNCRDYFLSIMKKSCDLSGASLNKRQIIIGLSVLLIGVLFYLVDRPPEQTYFVYKTSFNFNLKDFLPLTFGPLGNNLPTFAHVFSFILITAGLIASRKDEYFFICLFWFLVDSAFELGQKFSIAAAEYIPNWFAHVPFLENTKAYFLKGTFDPFDLAAIAAGTLSAYFILLTTTKGGEKSDEDSENGTF